MLRNAIRYANSMKKEAVYTIHSSSWSRILALVLIIIFTPFVGVFILFMFSAIIPPLALALMYFSLYGFQFSTVLLQMAVPGLGVFFWVNIIRNKTEYARVKRIWKGTAIAFGLTSVIGLSLAYEFPDYLIERMYMREVALFQFICALGAALAIRGKMVFSHYE